MENTNTDEKVDSSKEFYGEGAITGSAEGHDFEIKDDAGSEQIELKTDYGESALEEDPKEVEAPKADEKAEPETSITEEVNKANKVVESLGKDLTSKGVDFNKAIAEYEAEGKLSAETMEALKKAGYPADVVDGFIASRQALEARYVEQVYAVAGGQKEFEEATAWAKDNLTESEIASFNKAIDGGDINTVKLMLDGINAKRVNRYGTRNPSIVGGVSKGSSQGFANKAEMVKAINDPRYARDPLYTREVERKIVMSTFM